MIPLLTLPFPTLREAGASVPAFLGEGITAIEIINRQSVVLARGIGPAALPSVPESNLLFVEFEGEQGEALSEKVRRKTASLPLSGEPLWAETEEEIEKTWAFRKGLYPALMRFGPARRALSVVNDVGVPLETLPPFIEAVEKFFARRKMDLFLYGHAGRGNLHLRPLFDLTAPHLSERIEAVARGIYEIVFKYNGTITAEHGMGRIRAPFLQQEWGEKVYGLMKEVKSIFDPGDLFNPGVMFNDRPITEHLDGALRKWGGNSHG